ncbi:MAG TPA: type II toxin-antitoxin system VapC family toxin [Planctomycetota bacterium]|nr:type II toxin-antitoxin system VapC family toxin [Planctomycetota bacterium]
MTSGPSPRLLLDTGIVIGLTRNDAVGRSVTARYSLTADREPPLICAVSLGEAIALAARYNWGDEKRDRLIELFRRLPVVNIESGPVVNEYALLANHVRERGTPIGQNDLWIAAAASATRSVLVTTDNDFDRLPDGRPLRQWVDPKSGTFRGS